MTGSSQSLELSRHTLTALMLDYVTDLCHTIYNGFTDFVWTELPLNSNR